MSVRTMVIRVRRAVTTLRSRLRWVTDRVERALVLASRRPDHYILSVATVTAGVFSSLEWSDPVKKAIDALPVVTVSDWLGFVLFTVVIAAVLHLLSFAVRRWSGRDPVEQLAGLLDARGLLPSLSEHYERRMAGTLDAADAAHPLGYRVRHVGEHEVDLVCQINREVFARTGFATPLDIVKLRNHSVHRVNPLAFTLVEAEIDGRFVPVGMSAVLPLNRFGEAAYCRNGGLRDDQIRGSHIAPPGTACEAVLLFSVGLLRSFRGRLGTSPLTISTIFVDHAVEILRDIHAADPLLPRVRVFAQTELPGSGVTRLLDATGFADTGLVTGDGHPLRVLEVPLGALGEGAVPTTEGLRALLGRLRGRAAEH
ncbi:hypothetical protein [Nocardia thailandica]